MEHKAAELSDLFPMQHMRGILREFTPPDGDFDPHGAWTQQYRVYSITGGEAPVARLSLKRTPQEAGEFLLNIAYSHPLTPDVYTRVFWAVMTCRDDALATPKAWRVWNLAIDRQGRDKPNTSWERMGAFTENRVRVQDARCSRSYPVDAPVVNHWGLFEAVQRLPREAHTHTFTLLDDFNRPKPGQELRYRGVETVALGGEIKRRTREIALEKGRIRREEYYRENPRIVTLHRFEMTGWGIVPWVYFVDAQGRLLLAVSGIEGYVLDTGGQAV